MDQDANVASVGRQDASTYGTMSLRVFSGAERRKLEGDIAARFRVRFDARIHEFMPVLLGLCTEGRVAAAAGLRPAGKEPLFLEHYFDRPAEQAISAEFGVPVDRSQVAEIGNLVSFDAGATGPLFASLAATLADAGFHWVICTVTPRVAGLLEGMQFSPVRICEADPARLGDAASAWGRYYDCRPQVVAGDVRRAARVARQHRSLPRVARHTGLAEQIARHRHADQ